MSPLPDQVRTPSPGCPGSPLATVTLPRLEIALDPSDILRSLGHPPGATPSPDIIQPVAKLLREAEAYLHPCGTYSLYSPAAWTDRTFEIGGLTIVGDAARFFKGAGRIAVFMVTVGDEITRQAGMRGAAGDASTGRILDAIGSWAAERTAEALMTHLAAHLGPDESFTVRYSPGFCGMDLSQQRLLFQLAPAGTVGISLLPSLFMRPLKSISGLVGLGPREVVGIHLSPCEPCPLTGCHMRR